MSKADGGAMPVGEKYKKLLEVGDEVNYLPHECHAYNCNANNEYPWVIGERKNPHYEENPDTGEKELVEDVVELDEGNFHRVVLPAINRSPDPKEARKRLVPLHPKKPWKAVVSNVNSDGTVNLDVESNVGTGMTILHYVNVPLDEAKKSHHTCHRGAS
jgi:hypothetical protein